ncbi:hypothetical protein [Streptomyces sp. NPDC051211]|uniref:hypothetical protein n=1 Tax=Streptomyces sp. NPDC051211 TaxID=3154643 RepID=UPI00344BF5ED
MAARPTGRRARSTVYEGELPAGKGLAQSFYGSTPVQTFEDLCFETFILGCCSIDVAQGATAYNVDDVPVKRAAVAAASSLWQRPRSWAGQ